MENITDSDLVKELLKRLEIKDKAYHDLNALTKKLETLNNRLVESEKVKSHFLSNIKNEINNPLTSVLTICDLIVSGVETQEFEATRALVKTAYKEAFNLSFQLNNIFAAAEIEAGECAPGFSSVDIGSLINNTIEMFRHRAADKKTDVRLETKDDIRFTTDPEKLQLILSNFLSNAIEYSAEGASVEVAAARDGDGLSITVTDHGAGIDEKHHEVIFERFRQLDTGVAKSHAGHGLGLSIVKALVELLGGVITVKGKNGEGASFTVAIPEAAAREGQSVFAADGNEFFFGEAEGERF
ncbi:MAG: HAMP domain-containing sensor histidine kinase [Deltaproteobacteria bacterium]|nr:HAMP domain-containing sensor histidine kinase [Deltaproteobacteria bacterium]